MRVSQSWPIIGISDETPTDPTFGFLTFFASLASFLSGMGRRAAQRELKAAGESYDLSVRTYRRWSYEAPSRTNQLTFARLGYAHWLAPELSHVLKSTGNIGDLPDGLDGRTRVQIRNFLSRAGKIVVPPVSLLKTDIGLAIQGALVLKGLQWADRGQQIDVLHQTIGETVTSTGIPYAADIAAALGDIGDIGIADLVADGLLVFSAFRTLYNLGAMQEAAQTGAAIREKQRPIDQATEKLRDIAEPLGRLNTALDNAAFEAFKTATVARRAASKPTPLNRTKLLQMRVTNFWRMQSVSIRQKSPNTVSFFGGGYQKWLQVLADGPQMIAEMERERDALHRQLEASRKWSEAELTTLISRGLEERLLV